MVKPRGIDVFKSGTNERVPFTLEGGDDPTWFAGIPPNITGLPPGKYRVEIYYPLSGQLMGIIDNLEIEDPYIGFGHEA